MFTDYFQFAVCNDAQGNGPKYLKQNFFLTEVFDLLNIHFIKFKQLFLNTIACSRIRSKILESNLVILTIFSRNSKYICPKNIMTFFINNILLNFKLSQIMVIKLYPAKIFVVQRFQMRAQALRSHKGTPRRILQYQTESSHNASVSNMQQLQHYQE